MKIKKSDTSFVIQWVEIQLARDDKFPFEHDDSSSKSAKKHLKALKAWRKCTNSSKDVREWCEEWLDDDFKDKLISALKKSQDYKADHTVNLTREAYDLLLSTADKQEMSPSQLICTLITHPVVLEAEVASEETVAVQ